MARREFPAKVRKAVFTRAAGKCEACSAVLKKGEGEVDHILPDALGGKPELANAMLLCRVCHKAKSGADVGRIRKADREQKKHLGITRPKQSIRSAGFPKPDKPERVGKQALPPRPMFTMKETRT
jgi:5-methylcytosine-specific restriction protein A